jgi:heme/copper-type cytochrome/quinol oxidase subunit 2
MEKTQKIIVVLLIVAIVFSVISTLLNLSLVNFEFQPVNVRIPAEQVQGNPNGQLALTINERPSGGAG